MCPDEDEIIAYLEHKNKAALTEGTSHIDIKRVLVHFGIPHEAMSVRHKKHSPRSLNSAISGGKAVICHGNERRHWFVVIAPLYHPDDRIDGFVVVDSADADLVLKWDVNKLITEWGGTEGDNRCYGIVVG